MSLHRYAALSINENLATGRSSIQIAETEKNR